MSSPSPSAEKTERLLNLILCLKSTRRPLSKQRIRESLEDYRRAPSDEAFDRMFERDKDDLREMGIPISTTVIDVLFDDEVGYRIDSSEATLPAITFEPDEVAALALAARAWSGASISGAASAALRKLRLAGVEVDESTAVGVEPRIRTREAAFDSVHAAVLARQPITFGYRKASGEVGTRHVRPWALKNWHGRWYLTGFDVDREDLRAFRLSRFDGPARKKGRPGTYEIPRDHVPEVAVAAQEGDPVGEAVVRLRRGTGHALRRRASALRDLDDGWSELTLPYVRGTTEREIAALGPTAVAVSPDELVEAVSSALRGAATAHEAPETTETPGTHRGGAA
jgi:proteasome accessory factor B